MKLLLVGSDQVWSLERIYLKYLREAGVETELFAAQNLLYDFHSRSLINKIRLRMGMAGIYKVINQRLLENVDRFRPDVIWVFKGMEVLPETLHRLRAMKIPLANYNPDNPFVFTGRGSGNKNVTDSIPLYDLHFTYNLEIKKRLEEEFGLPVSLLPFGFELADEVWQQCLREPEIEIHRVCFVGNPDPQRAAIIQKLAEAGMEIDLYGNDWNKAVRHPGLQTFLPVYGDRFWKILRAYRVQLNLMRIHNENSHNMRSLEVPGVGGIMLAPDTDEHRMLFTDGEEAFLFRDVQECLRKARYILGLSAEAAANIRRKARIRSLDSGYTYKARTVFALDQLSKLHA